MLRDRWPRPLASLVRRWCAGSSRPGRQGRAIDHDAASAVRYGRRLEPSAARNLAPGPAPSFAVLVAGGPFDDPEHQPECGCHLHPGYLPPGQGARLTSGRWPRQVRSFGLLAAMKRVQIALTQPAPPPLSGIPVRGWPDKNGFYDLGRQKPLGERMRRQRRRAKHKREVDSSGGVRGDMLGVLRHQALNVKGRCDIGLPQSDASCGQFAALTNTISSHQQHADCGPPRGSCRAAERLAKRIIATASNAPPRPLGMTSGSQVSTPDQEPGDRHWLEMP
jgi:hypothetical protein